MEFRYPIGKYQSPVEVTPALRAKAIEEIAALPGKLRSAVRGLSDAQLDTRYREGGWTVRQVVHHLPDSHMNSYVRFRLALTEEQPLVKPYAEAKWAELPDAKSAPIGASLALLEALHERWVRLLRGMSEKDYARKLQHPEQGVQNLDWMLFFYEWHCRHHVAHINELRKRMNW